MSHLVRRIDALLLRRRMKLTSAGFSDKCVVFLFLAAHHPPGQRTALIVNLNITFGRRGATRC